MRENPVQLMRQAGYTFSRGIVGEEMSFIRPLEANGYPRFHVYLDWQGDNLSINLHLDQKRPSYGVGHAHSGEYDGEMIKNEMERIKRMAV